MRQGRRRRITGLIFAPSRRLAISAAVKPKPDSCTSSSAASQPRIRSLAGSPTATTSLRTRLDCAFGEPRRAQTARCFEKRFAEPCIFVKLPCRSHRVLSPVRLFREVTIERRRCMPISRPAIPVTSETFWAWAGTARARLCQRHLPQQASSLRAQRSDPESLRGRILDCFVARATRNDVERPELYAAFLLVASCASCRMISVVPARRSSGVSQSCRNTTFMSGRTLAAWP